MPVIVGPTAGGKTALAVALAHALANTPSQHPLGGGNERDFGLAASTCQEREKGMGGEVISADSMLIYKGMDIGTAKPTADERAGIPHHLIDIIQPTETFSVEQWLNRAEACIADIRARHRVPIVVGGTHLYAKALLEGLFQSPDPDPELRHTLLAMNPDDRRAELLRVDPQAAARIHPNDIRRTIRALEVFRQTGKPISEHQGQWDAGKIRPDALLVGLEWPISVINQRINARVKRMMKAGLLKEVRDLHASGRLGTQAREAVGYKQLIGIDDNPAAIDSAFERIKIETRRLAKNQRTWLRRLRAVPNSLWIPMEGRTPENAAQLVIQKMFTTE